LHEFVHKTPPYGCEDGSLGSLRALRLRSEPFELPAFGQEPVDRAPGYPPASALVSFPLGLPGLDHVPNAPRGNAKPQHPGGLRRTVGILSFHKARRSVSPARKNPYNAGRDGNCHVTRTRPGASGRPAGIVARVSCEQIVDPRTPTFAQNVLTCEDCNSQAEARAAQRPWWRRVFGR
jgi:hypothetical protein